MWRILVNRADGDGMVEKRVFTQALAAGNSRCPCQLRLIYEICLLSFNSTSRSAAVPDLDVRQLTFSAFCYDQVDSSFRYRDHV